MDTLQVDVSGLKNLITKLTKETVREIFSTPEEQRKRYLTRMEAAELMKVSLVTLNAWDKSKLLSPKKLGGRVYYDIIDIQDVYNKRK